MPTLKDLPIATAKPSDRPHILIWDSFQEEDLERLRFHHGTYRANYRRDLLQRHEAKSSSKFLRLDQRVDREIQSIRDLCDASPQSYVQLEECDRLITYLACTGGDSLTVFWQKLIDLRQLPKLLWIILPSSLVSPAFPSDRVHRIDPTYF
jgi:hypothetical protein